ncbi:MAG: hypothetical protein OWU32_01835 [Firmicutes bacterium]|nr:hypothetical protein [Bacillota bacterium]
MCTKAQCEQHVGQWVQFRTPYGHHIGLVERISGNEAIVVSPRQYVPAQFARTVNQSDEDKLDVALAFWGGGGYPRAGFGGGPRVGYGAGAVGRPGGYGGYGGYGFGWQRWAVSFLIIYALWGLLLW